MSARPALLLLAGLCASAAAAQAPPPGGPPRDRCEPVAGLYVAPMGQPFRRSGGGDPMLAWFAAADRDRDGRLVLAEFLADADAFFTTLDRDRDGEIDPQEEVAYETDVAPEIRLYQRGAPIDRRRTKDKRRYDEQTLGAGRFAQLNIPQPVASADADLNRGVSRAEFARAAATRFALLAGPAGALTAAAMTPTPAQAEAAACAAKLARQAQARR